MGDKSKYTFEIKLRYLNSDLLRKNNHFQSKLEETIQLGRDSGINIEIGIYPEITSELKNKVEVYFSNKTYKGFKLNFNLKKLERSNLDPATIYAVTEKIDFKECVGDDENWETALADIGKEFGVYLKPKYLFKEI